MESFKYGMNISLVPENSDTIVININNSIAGKIIGDSGSNIKKIRKNYNSKIHISNNNNRTLSISGADRFEVFALMLRIIPTPRVNF
jgi:ribosomal protein S3